MSIVISVENLSKTYRLGQIGTGTFANDLKLWWAKARGKPNPLLKIGEREHGNRDGEIVWALKDVSFTVEQGEVLGIIGRNGAGKSTLLKILSRVTAPTSGKIMGKGRIASLLEVGTGFHPELTGRENIYLNGAILGMSRKEIDRKFEEIVDFAEVEKFIDTPVKRYSSGMYVRLAFAVAAHLEPEILLVDEVLAVGDAEFQKKCLGKMGDVAKEGRTVLFVSHNMLTVQKLCPRVMWLYNGGVNQDGLGANVITSYLSLKDQLYTWVDCTLLDHSGSGEAKIISARVLDKFTDECSTFTMGDPIVVEFMVDAVDENLSLSYAVELTDSQGMPILHLWDRDNNSPRISGNQRKISATITNIALFPGRYHLTLWTGHETGLRVDRVESCLSIDITQNVDYSRDFIRSRGVIHHVAKWEYENLACLDLPSQAVDKRLG